MENCESQRLKIHFSVIFQVFKTFSYCRLMNINYSSIPELLAHPCHESVHTYPWNDSCKLFWKFKSSHHIWCLPSSRVGCMTHLWLTFLGPGAHSLWLFFNASFVFIKNQTLRLLFYIILGYNSWSIATELFMYKAVCVVQRFRESLNGVWFPTSYIFTYTWRWTYYFETYSVRQKSWILLELLK